VSEISRNRRFLNGFALLSRNKKGGHVAVTALAA
jgi:hypothetical protein